MPTEIFVATYNILYGSNKQVFKSIDTLSTIGDKYDHAFLGLQEARNKTDLGYIETNINKILKNHHIDYYLADEPTPDDLGLALASTEKAISSKKIMLPKLAKRPWRLQSYLLDHMPINGAISNIYEIDGKRLRITNMHLNNIGGIKHKVKQTKEVLAHLSATAADCDIAFGDFNTIGMVRINKGIIYRQLKAIRNVLGDEYEIVNPGFDHTLSVAETINPSMPLHSHVQKTVNFLFNGFKQKTDWILARNLEITGHGVYYDLKGSDHYPIWATFKTPA